MNVMLEKLFETYMVSPKDQHEIRQIFIFVSEEKKQKLLDNFKEIISEFQVLRENLHAEQEILLGETLSNIEAKLFKIQQKKLTNYSKDKLEDLRKVI